MNTRIALLAEIEAQPLEDTPRLAYADHLEENDCFGSDLCRATAEFIRISCGREAVKLRQTRDEGRWLEANWRRLVPEFAGRYVHRRPHRCGRWIPALAEIPLPPVHWADGTASVVQGPPNRFSVAVRLEFWRGFLRRCLFESPLELDLVVPELAAEQPLIQPDLTYLPPGDPHGPGEAKLTYGDVGESFAWLPGGAEAIAATTSQGAFTVVGGLSCGHFGARGIQHRVAFNHKLSRALIGLRHVLRHLAHAPLRWNEILTRVFMQRAIQQRKQ